MKAALTHIHKLFLKYFFTLDLLSHHVTITFSIDFLKGEQLQLKQDFSAFLKNLRKICSRCYELPRDLFRVFKES